MKISHVIVALCFVATAIAIDYPPTLTLQATFRDFWACNTANSDVACGQQSNDLTSCPTNVCHPDFERYESDDRGIPQTFLDLEGKPVLNTTSPHPSITSAEAYAQFFRNIPGKNMAYLKNITLDYCPDCGTGFYKYANTSMFALDYEGWGNYYNNHNYHFTAEFSTTFVYTGGEVFNFLGDDDVWVFIDNELVLDLGGAHLAETGSIVLDDLNLEKFVPHTMKIFYCERHTSLSELTITTSILFKCDLVDRCGVCHGDGQSCCTCDDGNACTYQTCDPDSKDQVCIFTPMSCDDGNNCTLDSCSNGQCYHSVNTCDDANSCTIDTCSNSTGCAHTPVSCDDNNTCTSDTCNSTTGCTHAPVSCDDGNACTTDSCDSQNGCSNTPITCNDNDLCTLDSCNATSGCTFIPVQCDNGAKCDSTTGKCVAPVPPSCGRNSCCDDANPCTIDSCDGNGGCRYTQVAAGTACNDGQVCNGADTCDANGTCSVHTGIMACGPNDQLCIQICLHLAAGVSL